MEITRESIFTSSVRAFFNAFFALVGVIIGLVIFAFIVGAFVGGKQSPGNVMVVVEPDAQGSTEMLPPTAPVILRIDVKGPIIPPNISYQLIEKQLTESRKGVLNGNRVKGVMLCCDTPGGTITDSFGIYQRLMEYKERFKVPVYSFTEGTCASGGVFISSAADKALCTELSIIGSVGVVMGPIFNYSGLMEKLGIEAKTISEGKSKVTLPFWKPWTPEDGQDLVPIAQQAYKVFLNVVTQARKGMDREKLVDEYGAKIFDAETAQAYGYVEDGNATYSSALTDLAKAAGIEEKYQVIRLKVRPSYLDSLIMNGPLGALKKWIAPASGSNDKVLYIQPSP